MSQEKFAAAVEALKDFDAFEAVNHAFDKSGVLVNQLGNVALAEQRAAKAFNRRGEAIIGCPSDYEKNFQFRLWAVFGAVADIINEQDCGIRSSSVQVDDGSVYINLQKLDCS